MWRNILSKVTPRWYVQSNRSGYFYNALQILWEVYLWEWRILSEKKFLPFLQKVKIFLTHRRKSKYDAGHEFWPSPTESHDIREQEILNFATLNHTVYLNHDKGRRIL